MIVHYDHPHTTWHSATLIDMVTVAGKAPRPGGQRPGGPRKSTTPPGKPKPNNNNNNKNGTLNTSKGTFSFTMVADGCYIEHKWGQNSGHVGVPLEAIPGFITRLQNMYQKTTVPPP